MNHFIRQFIFAVVTASLFICCKSADKRDESAARAAIELAQAAAEELSFTADQKQKLETAAYILYKNVEPEAKTKGESTEKADMCRQAMEKFKSSLEEVFPKTTTAEIIAWYYKYSNGKK